LTYLLTQIFISLLLAGLAGGAFGWILHGFKANQRERELKTALNRHDSALAQAQQERQMIADDYDEMKLGLESRISELQYENRKVPDLEENLEKSQQLVIQMIKKHEAETSELSAQNNNLHSEIDTLKSTRTVNTAASVMGRRQEHPGSDKSDSGTSLRTADRDYAYQGKADHGKANATAANSISRNASLDNVGVPTRAGNNVSPTASPSESTPSRSSAVTSASAEAKRSPLQSPVTVTNAADVQQDRNPDVDLNEARANDTAAADVTSADTAAESMDSLQKTMIADSEKHWEAEAAEQNELLALESEIEEMRAMDGHLIDQGDPDFEHERELDLNKVEESDAIKIARDIEHDVTTPVTVKNIQPASEGEILVTKTGGDGEEDDRISTADTSDDSMLRSSLREKFSGKDDDDVDDLQIIHGIGPVIERSLNDIGITSFNQLATLTRREIEEVAEILKIFPGRIERDNWIGNARRLVSTDSDSTRTAGSSSSCSKPDTEEFENA